MSRKLEPIVITRIAGRKAASEAFPLLIPTETVSGWYMATGYLLNDHPYFTIAVIGYKIHVEHGQVREL